MFRRIKFMADAGEVIRSVCVSSLAIALAVYAMVREERRIRMVVLGALVLLIAVLGIFQVSYAIRGLHRRHKAAREVAARAELHYFKVLRRLLTTIEAREQHTRGRSKRIGSLAKRIGRQLGLNRRQCTLLKLAGQVHDIGLLAVPEQILNSPRRLGAEEFRTVQKHAEMSFTILEPLTFLSEIMPAVRYHHERMNGTGYPDGLKGDQIPLKARILAVADAYDAMVHDRPRRPALSPLQAFDELERCAPAGYDPRCVAALEEVMNVPCLREAHQAGEAVRSPLEASRSQEAVAKHAPPAT